MRKKIAIIGDRNSVLAFKCLGVEVFTPDGKDEIRNTIDTLADEDYKIILITEQMADLVQDTIARYDSAVTPAITLVPSNKGSLGVGLERIDKNIEKAIGSSIV